MNFKKLNTNCDDIQSIVFSSVRQYKDCIYFGKENGEINIDRIYYDDNKRYYFTVLNEFPPAAKCVSIMPDKKV